MDQAMPKPGFTKPIGGFIVVLFVALFIGGWLYVDMIKNELEMKIEALSAEADAALMEAKGASAKWTGDAVPTPSETSLVFSSDYGFALTTPTACASKFVVREDPKPFPNDAKAEYQVLVPGSKEWPAGFAVYSYVVMSQDTYDALSGGELPGKPDILAVLKDGLLLTRYSPQDGPEDIGNCSLSIEITP